MAELSKSVEIQQLIDGQELFPATNIREVALKASFLDGDSQPVLSTTDFEFILDSYTYLKEWIANQKILEGVPYSLNALSTVPTVLPNNNIFEGYIDLRNALIDDTNGIIQTTVRYKDDITSLSARVAALDFGYLYSIGVFTDSDFVDVDYQVLKKDKALETIILSGRLFAYTKSLIEITRLLADNVATIAALTATAVTGGVGATIYAIASAIFNLAYAIALLAEIIRDGRALVNLLFPPKRTHKAILFKTMLEKVCNYLGYQLNTTVKELDFYTYLPSNRKFDEYEGLNGLLSRVRGIENGLPNSSDYGYTVPEFLQLIKDMFNGKFAILDGVVQFHSELNPFWERYSTFERPDILEPPYRYNTEELKGNIFINFATDITDDYTLDNFKGTNYQVITEPTNFTSEKSVLLQGLEEFNFPLALGTRKEKLTGFEKLLKFVGGFIDTIVNTIGSLFGRGNTSNLADSIQDRIGILIVSTNNHNVPKILYLDNGRIPKNHRDLLSAKYLYNNYIKELSPTTRQRKLYENVEIPFGWEDFQELVKNSYFSDTKGKIEELDWIMLQDKATASWYETEIYTTNLKQTFIEAE